MNSIIIKDGDYMGNSLINYYCYCCIVSRINPMLYSHTNDGDSFILKIIIISNHV